MASTPVPGSALTSRPIPQNMVLSEADQDRMRHAYSILANMISASKTEEKKTLIVWETTRFAINVAHHLSLPLPIANTTPPSAATRQAATTLSANAPAPNSLPLTPPANTSIEPSAGIDAVTITGLRELGIRPSDQDSLELALGQALSTRKTPVLTPITFGPSLLVSIETLVSQRAAFIDDLLHAEVLVMKNLTQETQTFGRDEAYKIANQIFNDLVGFPAVKHVEALLTEYKALDDAGLDSAVGAKAQLLSTDLTIPRSLRDFLATFALHQRNQSKLSKPKLTALHVTATELTLQRCINKLMNPASSRERRALLDFFQRNGYLETGAGRRLKTGVKSFFLRELGLTENALTWVTDSLLPVSQMVELFGNGILIFLSREHIRQIRVFGIAKMSFAFRRLDDHCPWVAELADMADEHMLSPILAGMSLANFHFKTAPTIPWSSRFRQLDEDADAGH